MARGGARNGAGRPGWHVKVETLLRLDVRSLRRGGWLSPGASCTWGWQADGRTVATIKMHADDGALVLAFSIDRVPVCQRVAILRSPCHLGGERRWFTCPQCGRRVAVLFLRSRFRCRICSKAAYVSQSKDALDRAWRRQRKLESRLGEHLQRPKGMHAKTYGRLVLAILSLERAREEALYALVQQRLPNLLGP